MNELRICTACNRHVRTDDAACPFCAAAVATSPQRSTPSRLARAAIFTAALAGGCGNKTTPPKTVGNVEPAAKDAGVDAPVKPPDNSNIPMPYGAPPMRRRLV